MRLLCLSENISRSDFFDLYALVYAYQSDPGDVGVRRRLYEHLRYVLGDHVGQLRDILVDRLGPSTVDDAQVGIYRDHGAEFESLGVIGGREGIGEISVPDGEKLGLLRDLYGFAVSGGGRSFSMFTSIDGVWFRLLGLFLNELVRVPSSIDGMVLAVDRIYGLMHHGGFITDYFDESRWIEDALNTRANAGPSGILRLASDDVRSLVFSASNGLGELGVSSLQKLGTAFARKWPNGDFRVRVVGDELQLSGTAYVSYGGPIVPSMRAFGFKKYTRGAFDGGSHEPVEFEASIKSVPSKTRAKPALSSQFVVSVNGGEFKPVSVSARSNQLFGRAAEEIERIIGAEY